MARKVTAVLQEEINNNDDWTKTMENQGMYGKKTNNNLILTKIITFLYVFIII